MTILTIDFDIIMSPSINFYNDLIELHKPFSEMVKDYPFLESSFPANLYQYQFLTRLIVYWLGKRIPIKFINNHDEIIKIFKEYKSPIDVINIDHHHDIGYDYDNWRQVSSHLDCGNWAKYALDRNLIRTYQWVKNENSYDAIKEAEAHYITKKMTFEDFSKTPFYDLKIDLVVVCGSWEWIPPDFIPLYNTWQSIADEVKPR